MLQSTEANSPFAGSGQEYFGPLFAMLRFPTVTLNARSPESFNQVDSIVIRN